MVTLDREPKRNAVNPAMTAGLDRALNLLEDDPELRVVGVIQDGATAFSPEPTDAGRWAPCTGAPPTRVRTVRHDLPGGASDSS